MTKEDIQKNSEHWYEKYKEVKHELEQERKLNAEIKARFVKCNTCTDEMKDKCLMFSENLCEGERCEELVDLMALVSKSDLQKENEQLKAQIEKMKFWHDREEMVVIRDLLTEYMGRLGYDEDFDIAIFNVRNRLNGELKDE